MKRWQKNLFILGLFVSLFLHFGTGLWVYFVAKTPTKPEAIEISIVDNNLTDKVLQDRARQIVEQSEQQINDEIDDKAKYLSRHNQRVAEETRAEHTGKFQNDAKEGEAKKENKPQQEVAENKKQKSATEEKSENLDGDIELPKLSALKPRFQWDKIPSGVSNPGPRSQTDDHLKDMLTGPQTLLSSREFVYYTYYSRIKERLRMFWEPKIKEKVARLFMSGRHLASEEDRITRLVITLDNKGKLVRVQVLGASGLKDLDDAAIEAFQAAAPFPNPPSGIVEADGTIKIRWDFILEA
ncbi:MAG: TonB family protein [Oligoflexia bacterium]|nr:TonB family protein [Oligoflexia bacterium]